MKKKLSILLALIMSLSVLSTACTKTSEEAETTTAAVTTTTAQPANEESAVSETEAAAEESVTEETTTAAEEVVETVTLDSVKDAASAIEATKSSWTETAVSKTMYTTAACYSRKTAVVGAKSVKQYKKGVTVTVVAVTSTGYYKLKDGTFIHSDYLKEKKAAASTTKATTTAAATTTGKSGTVVGAGTAVKLTGKAVDYKTRYGYKQLTAEQKALYAQFVEAAMNLQPVVEPKYTYSKEDVVKVYSMVFNQESQLFWLGSSIPTGSKYLFLTYKEQDPAKIAAMQKKIDANVKSLMSKISGYKSTVSKLKVLYDWVIVNAEFSIDGAGYNSTIYNGLLGGANLQCAGYAKTMEYLCDQAGIQSMVIIGANKKNESHAWNVVYCDNGWYNLDATWGDPMNKFGADYIRYEFLLVPDSWIHNKTHFSINKKIEGTKVTLFTPPACTKTACNYFNANKKTYSTLTDAEKALNAAISDAVKNGKNVAEIRVNTKELYDTMMSDTNAKVYNKYAKGLSANVVGLSKQFSDSFGVQVVHYDIVYK